MVPKVAHLLSLGSFAGSLARNEGEQPFVGLIQGKQSLCSAETAPRIHTLPKIENHTFGFHIALAGDHLFFTLHQDVEV